MRLLPIIKSIENFTSIFFINLILRDYYNTIGS